MLKIWSSFFTVLTFVAILLGTSDLYAGGNGIELVGRGSISGSALDLSGLTGEICQAGTPINCVPNAILGGFGSDITFTGHNNVFIAAPDRGPFDGLTNIPYLNRFHFLQLTTNVTDRFPNIRANLLETRFLTNEAGQNLVGAAGSFDVINPFNTLRFDPEGIRVAPDGTFYVSDEYGPYIYRFNPQGQLLNRLAVPAKFFIANPNADPTMELLGNTSGRQANRGMEGLAISPDGTTLFGIMQSALLQDNGLSPGTTNRLGLNNRILKIDLNTGATQEFVYVLDAINRGQGVSEILAINDHEFLVLERDNRSNLQMPPQAPTRKTIYKIDINNATDVSAVASLPAGALPSNITPVNKSLFIDLLDPSFFLASTISEKIEGLAWGPDLADGKHLLYVVSDNDLLPNLSSQIFSFAIDPSVINYQPQIYPAPIFSAAQTNR